MTICVCGAGTMGSGIAQVAAQAGHTTLLYDLGDAAVQAAAARIAADLEALVRRQKISPEKKKETLSRIRYITDPNDCVADIVIEAIVEKLDVKVALFNRLATINPADTIFATNTSSLSVTELARAIPHPERVAGLHFFNPAPLMKLVEVVQGEATSPAVTDQLVALTKGLGKQPVVCRDAPGFIVNRVARPYYIESLRLAEEGIDMRVIDRLLEARGFRMGPFKLMDLIGNDVNYAVSCSVYDQLGAPERLRPSHLQKERVEAGHLGKKSGKGYYEYERP